MLAAEFEALDDDAKAPWEAKAAEDAERFAAEQAGYEAFLASKNGKAEKGKAGKAAKGKKAAKAAEGDDE